MLGRDKASQHGGSQVRILLASSNEGKLSEYRQIAESSGIEMALIPNFPVLPAFNEAAPTFAENGAGKVLHYSSFTEEPVLADDSGLVVPALGGAPGVHSARYAGPHATDTDRLEKLLGHLAGKKGAERRARFVCVVALAQKGRALAVVSNFVEGTIAPEPRGSNGFGYDSVFFSPELGCTFAEASPEEKNRYSHRGKAFRVLIEFICTSNSVTLF